MRYASESTCRFSQCIYGYPGNPLGIASNRVELGLIRLYDNRLSTGVFRWIRKKIVSAKARVT
jgi:hypothetical protein